MIIIAIIIVIGLVVVSLLVNQTGSSGNISSSVSKIFSSSGMISISEAVVGLDGNGLISLSNNSGGSIVVTRLSVNGVDTNYSNVSLIFGDKKIFSLKTCRKYENKLNFRTLDPQELVMTPFSFSNSLITQN